MVISALVLTVLGILVCFLALRKTLAFFGLDLMETLVYLGLAEVRAPAPRRSGRHPLV